MGFRGNEANSEIYKRVREHFPERRRTAVDAGAYIGEWTRMLAEDFETVLAFEIRPETFATLHTDLPENVIALNLGLGAAFGKKRFALRHGRYAQIESSRHGPDLERHEYEVRGLDEFTIKQCDFIKIDVDGMEADVLEGARETIEKWRPIIAIEVKLMDDETKQRLLAMLNYRSTGRVSAIDEIWVPA